MIAPRWRRYLLAFFGVPFGLLVLLPSACWVAAASRESETRTSAAPATGHFVRSGDVELFVQESGPVNGTPVLLVHGTGAWSAIWRPTMDALADAGYRAIALDLPPFGFSERPTVPRYDDAAQAARLLGLMEALDLRGAILVGHSFGARPTVEAVLRDASRVHALVLVDAALNPATANAITEPPAFPVRAAVSLPMIRNPLVATTLTNPLLTKRLFQQLIFDPNDATDDLVRMIRQQFVVERTTAALGTWVQQFVRSDAPALNHDRARYTMLTMPTLLIWGDKDDITPLSKGREILSLLPNAEMITLANTGHIPAIEDPEQFHRALLMFLTAKAPVVPP
jgi:pimeloyl-ACP methyl ester carboxylesterase